MLKKIISCKKISASPCETCAEMQCNHYRQFLCIIKCSQDFILISRLFDGSLKQRSQVTDLSKPASTDILMKCKMNIWYRNWPVYC